MCRIVPALTPRLSHQSPGFSARVERVRALCDELAAHLARARAMGPEELKSRHTARGKLLARERVAHLLDPGGDFLELQPLAAFGHYDDEVPAAGVVCGVGPVHGRDCVLMVNDATVKGGTFYPLTVKKNLRAQEVAARNNLPCIYLVDSGGAFLPLQSEIFPDREHGGRVFYNQARMSRAGTPQLAAVMGSCTAGGAYTPAMAEIVAIVKGSGTVFLAGPPLVKAATGEEVSAEELGGADVHCRMSGLADRMASDDRDALNILRDAVRNLADAPPPGFRNESERLPLGEPDEILGTLPLAGLEYDPLELIARLVDAGDFDPFKPLYGPEMACGFARLGGWPAGIVASAGPLTSAGVLKAAHFVAMTASRGWPLIFLVHVDEAVDTAPALAKDAAKLMREVACTGSPIVTVVVGGAVGPAALALGGRAFGPRFTFLLPTARVHAGSPYASSGLCQDDGVIDPRDLRRTLARAIGITARTARAGGYAGPVRF